MLLKTLLLIAHTNLNAAVLLWWPWILTGIESSMDFQRASWCRCNQMQIQMTFSCFKVSVTLSTSIVCSRLKDIEKHCSCFPTTSWHIYGMSLLRFSPVLLWSFGKHHSKDWVAVVWMGKSGFSHLFFLPHPDGSHFPKPLGGLFFKKNDNQILL